MYAYCLNNPVNNYDVTGYSAWETAAKTGLVLMAVGVLMLATAATGGGALALAAGGTAALASAANVTFAAGAAVTVGSFIYAADTSNKNSGKDYQSARGNKQANEWAQKVGYKDAEMLKQDYVGSDGAKFNLFRNKVTDELILIGFRGALKGIEVVTQLFLK